MNRVYGLRRFLFFALSVIGALPAAAATVEYHLTIAEKEVNFTGKSRPAIAVNADIVAEWVLVLFPLTLFGMKIFGSWTVDYVVALAFGIVFQFFTIAPMRNLGVGEGLVQASKADFLSLTAWQVGMYGWMAIATFVIFGREIEKTDPIFWFMMQIAMLAGFLTSYPVNWWLLRSGIKEKM